MKPQPDFDGLPAYRALAEITVFIRGVQDRFPQDEIPVLYDRMLAAAVEAGADLASGFARDGLDAAGVLPASTRRDVGARLGELRHYVLSAASSFILDERHVATFETLYGRAREALEAPAGPR